MGHRGSQSLDSGGAATDASMEDVNMKREVRDRKVRVKVVTTKRVGLSNRIRLWYEYVGYELRDRGAT